MSSMKQLEENLATADNTDIGSFTKGEKKAIAEVKKVYESKTAIMCTDCRYCLLCPHGVSIPFVFDYFNMAKVYDDVRTAKGYYSMLGDENNAAKCTMCGKCVEHCPQNLQIIDLLKECHELLYTPKVNS